MRQRLARIYTYLILLALAPSARAQPLPGAGSITPTGAAGTHAWACVPLRSDSQSVAILHLQWLKS